MKTKVGSEGGGGTFQLFYINIKKESFAGGGEVCHKKGALLLASLLFPSGAPLGSIIVLIFILIYNRFFIIYIIL